jgi:hypothetical protein
MESQWREILLDFDPRVTAATDTETIRALESRAPAISCDDRDFLAKKFKKRLLFPGLEDQALRDAVELAVYRQGPILTLTTFGHDIKIISRRILEPLRKALGPKNASENGTVRSKLLQYFREHYIKNVRTAIGICAERDRYAYKCFERLFLQLIQTATPKNYISEADLQNIARQEFLEIDRSSCIVSSTSRDDGIEISVENRHGKALFQKLANADWLLSDVIRDPDPACNKVSVYFMVKYITSLFLFGTPPPRNASSPPPKPIAKALPTAANAVDRLLFDGSNPPSTQSLSALSSASNDLDDTSSESRSTWSESTQQVCGDRRREPRFVTIGDFTSQRASITGWHSSRISTTSYGESLKRDVTSYESPIFFPEQKRPRLTTSVVVSKGESPTLKNGPSRNKQYHQMSRCTSLPSVTTPDRGSYAEEYDPASHAYSTPLSSIDGRECYQDESFSPSDYDRSWSPITQRSATTLPNTSCLHSYRDLVNLPFGRESVHGDEHVSAPADANEHNASSTRAPSPCDTMPAGRRESIQRTSSPRVAGCEAIEFKLSSNKDMFYRTTRTLKSLHGFIKSQRMIDASSKFSYMVDGKTVDAPTDACLLNNLKIIDSVIVHSKEGHFASTQHPSIVHF